MKATTGKREADVGTNELQGVAAAVGRVFRDRVGRGPVKCRATWSGPDVMLVLVEGAATISEDTLRIGGHSELVLEERRKMQNLIESDLRTAVEVETGRSIRTFLSAARLDPDVAAEIFLFDPVSDQKQDDPEALPERLREALQENRELVRDAEALAAEHQQAARQAAKRKSRPAAEPHRPA